MNESAEKEGRDRWKDMIFLKIRTGRGGVIKAGAHLERMMLS